MAILQPCPVPRKLCWIVLDPVELQHIRQLCKCVILQPLVCPKHLMTWQVCVMNVWLHHCLCPFQSEAEKLESQARALSGPDGLVPDASGSDLQKALAAVAAATSDGKFAYNRFFAVGLFRWVPCGTSPGEGERQHCSAQ